MKNSLQLLSIIGLLISTSIWGSTFFVIKDALSGVDPIALVAYRFSIAAIIFAVIVLVRKEKLWAHAKHGFFLGFWIWLLYIFQTLGLQYTTASNSGFISGLFIIFVPFFGVLFFNTKPKILQLIALGISLIGLWFLTGGWGGINVGDLLTLLTAASIGISIQVSNKFVKEKKSVTVLGFQQFFTVAVLSFTTAIIFQIPLTVTNSQAVWSLIYLALFGSVIAQGLLLVAQLHLNVVTSSLLLTTEPLFAALFAWTLGNEAFVPEKAVGGIFIVIALIISEIPLKKEKSN